MNRKSISKIVSIAAICIMMIALYILGMKGREAVAAKMEGKKEDETKTVVIDAGHGGIDPGKVVGAVNEKDINISIALKLKKELEDEGIKVVMTRVDDEGLYDINDRNKKVTDMNNRCTIVNDSDADILVSIHQNSYEDVNVKGAQVFYYEHSKKGQKLATNIQSELCKYDKDNKRKEKGNDSYYLLLNVKVPAVIVECGFLTNVEERELLKSDIYQEEIARCIKDGINQFFKNE